MKLSEKVFVIYLLILQSLIIWRNISTENYDVFFFVCDHIAILLALSFIFGKYNFVKALINVALLGQLFWIADLISKFFFEFYLFEVTIYIFEGDSFFWGVVSSLVHFTTIIPALFLTMKNKINRDAFFIAILYLAIVYLLSLLFTDPASNIACVYNACGISFVQFEHYTLLYLPLAVLIVILPTHCFQKFLKNMVFKV